VTLEPTDVSGFTDVLFTIWKLTYLWGAARVTFTCDLHVWPSRVTFTCDLHVWPSRVTFTGGRKLKEILEGPFTAGVCWYFEGPAGSGCQADHEFSLWVYWSTPSRPSVVTADIIRGTVLSKGQEPVKRNISVLNPATRNKNAKLLLLLGDVFLGNLFMDFFPRTWMSDSSFPKCDERSTQRPEDEDGLPATMETIWMDKKIETVRLK